MAWYIRKYFILTLMLTAFLLVPPFFNQAENTIIVDILFFVLMLCTVYTVAHNKVLLSVGLILTVITQWGSFTTQASINIEFIIGLVSAITLLLMVIAIIIKDIISEDEVYIDAVFGSISAYLLIGVTWALVYYLTDTLIPGAIFVNTDLPADTVQLLGKSDFGFYNYFSFVSMTTLGYGDLIPAHPITRALSTYQAIFGQMFIAILVARLVALHIARN